VKDVIANSSANNNHGILGCLSLGNVCHLYQNILSVVKVLNRYGLKPQP